MEKVIICSRIIQGKCDNDSCRYHPAAAPIDGQETELRDMLMQAGCPGRSRNNELSQHYKG